LLSAWSSYVRPSVILLVLVLLAPSQRLSALRASSHGRSFEMFPALDATASMMRAQPS
jgi:hypothetical protein